MTIDKFGRSQIEANRVSFQQRNPNNLGFKINSDGDFDFQLKQIINLKDPVNPNDTATKQYVDIAVTFLRNYVDKEIKSTKTVLNTEIRNASTRAFGYSDTLVENLRKEIKSPPAKKKRT